MNAGTDDASRWIRSGLGVSAVSIVWTALSGGIAVAIGLQSDGTVLVAFGLIGMIDAVGSSALVVHFRHALRHEAVSLRRERATARLVTLGMALVGVFTGTVSVGRIVDHANSRVAPIGTGLAALSVVVLVVLAKVKRKVAHQIPSDALRADSWLSATGALLAVFSVAGTGLQEAFGWWWSDPSAAVVVSVGALILGVKLFRTHNVEPL